MTIVLLHNCTFIALLHSLRRAAFLSLFLSDYLSPLLLAAGLNPSSKLICRASGNGLEIAGWSRGASLPSAQMLSLVRRLSACWEGPRRWFPMEPLAVIGTRRSLLCQEEGKRPVQSRRWEAATMGLSYARGFHLLEVYFCSTARTSRYVHAKGS